jgi:hypothetical protein
MLSPTEEAAGEAVLTEAVTGSITGMGNTQITAGLIRRRATANPIPNLSPKRMQRHRRTHPKLNPSPSHPSSR